MKKKDTADAQASAFRPIKAIGSIFRLRRDLVGAIKKRILPGSGLNLEAADMLLALYGAAQLGWDDPAADADGFVTFQELQSSLAHSAASLTKQVASLKAAGWVDSCEIHKLRSTKGRIDKRAKALRITVSGRKMIEPVYAKYCRFCNELLEEFTAEDQLALDRINDALMRRIRGTP